MSTAVQTATTPTPTAMGATGRTHSVSMSSEQSARGSTATFGVPMRGFGAMQQQQHAPKTARNVPEVNVNGEAPPATPRTPKPGPAAGVAEPDSQWGANFWVTLIEPQVRRPRPPPRRTASSDRLWPTSIDPLMESVNALF